MYSGATSTGRTTGYSDTAWLQGVNTIQWGWTRPCAVTPAIGSSRTLPYRKIPKGRYRAG